MLLLWVDEDLLTSARTPIRSLIRLHDGLKQSGYNRFAILGPQDSTTLAAMAKEMEQGKALCPGCFSIYNFGATAQDTAGPPYAIGFPTKSLHDLFKKAKLQYSMTVTTDEELARALACELMRRDPSIRLSDEEIENLPRDEGPANHIVLISDWDTVYGASLAKTVKCIFEHSKPQDGCHQSKPKETPDKPKLSSVLVASYLRGLDGRLPNRRDAGQKEAAKSAGDTGQQPAEPNEQKPSTIATPETAPRFESAEGQSQYDYLSRLAADLKARDAEFLRTDGGHISAIGVLGSDVYDKLLILQALRPEFPNANFFTTDLDALLLPDKKSHYTRNLIVASSYGLQLDPSLECGIPSFRNSYQTSIFVAAARAIHDNLPGSQGARPTSELDAAINTGKPQPLLFQIGRTSAQPLPTETVTPVPAPSLSRCIRPNPVNGAHPIWPPVEAADIGILPTSVGTRLAVFLIPLLLICSVFIPRRVRIDCFTRIGRRPNPARWCRGLGWFMAGLVPAVAFGLWIWLTFRWESAARLLTENGLGDPISVFEGISIWPVIALRAAGFLLAVFLVWYTFHALEVNQQETFKRFNEHRQYERFRQVWKKFRREQQMNLQAAIRACLGLGRVPAAAIIQREDDPRDKKMKLSEITTEISSHWITRLMRALFYTLIMFLSLGFWFWLRPDLLPFVPTRGSRAYSIFNGISAVDFLTTMFLTFLIVDATLYSRSFIRWLTFVRTEWSSDTIKEHLRRYQLTYDADSGGRLKKSRRAQASSLHPEQNPAPESRSRWNFWTPTFAGTLIERLSGYSEAPGELFQQSIGDWLDLQFLAERTRCITKLVYFPFIALAILIFSRSPLFDNFSTPWSVVVPYAASLCVIIAAVIAYRRSAEDARRVACRHVTNRIIAAKGKGDDATAGQLERLWTDMQELREGAFASWASQPLLRAVLLPLLTYGGAMLAHLYALPGL